MNHKLNRLPDAQIEVFVEFDHSELDPHLKKAVEELSTEHPVEGFRPGKAPLDVVKKHFGEIKVYERALTHAINAAVPKLIAEEKLRIVGRPEFSVRKLAPGNPAEFVMKAHIIPDFALPDFESIAKKVLKTKMPQTVATAEVEDALNWLREERSRLEKVERPARKGDAVEIDFSAAENGAPVGHESKNHPLTIGKGSMAEGFEDELIGMQAGEEKKFSLKVSEKHSDAAIAGKKLDFTVKLALVRERILPDLADSFAQSLGGFESLENLKTSIRDGIREEKEIKERDRVRLAIADGIAEETDLPLPAPMIANELEKMIAELKMQMESMGLKYGDYLAHLKKTEEALKLEWHEDAKRRVKIALILRAVAEAKHIQPSVEEVEAEVGKILARFGEPEKAAEAAGSEALENYARGAVRNEKVFEYLESLNGLP